MLIDTPGHCLDLAHWHSYPHAISYHFNSRGFRDLEWPADLRSAVWCVGDSFTLGIGQPWSHTWPQVFEHYTAQRTINVSMDGASNDWISRRGRQIIAAVAPRLMIVQWSYLHRRELQSTDQTQRRLWQAFYRDVRDASWPSCIEFDQFDQLPERIQQEIQCNPYWVNIVTPDDHDRRQDQPDREEMLSDSADLDNLLRNIQQLEQQHTTEIIHTFIPQISPNGQQFQQWLKQHMTGLQWLPEIQQQDRARDGHHYDIVTADAVVQSVLEILNK